MQKHCSEIPVPDTIYEHADEDRPILILSRAHGLTLRDAWADLSPPRCDAVLGTVFKFSGVMAAQTAWQKY